MRYMLGDMKLLGRWDLNSAWGHGLQQQGLCSIPGALPQQGHIMPSFGELNFLDQIFFKQRKLSCPYRSNLEGATKSLIREMT